jgi:hypothetical protein
MAWLRLEIVRNFVKTSQDKLGSNIHQTLHLNALGRTRMRGSVPYPKGPDCGHILREFGRRPKSAEGTLLELPPPGHPVARSSAVKPQEPTASTIERLTTKNARRHIATVSFAG